MSPMIASRSRIRFAGRIEATNIARRLEVHNDDDDDDDGREVCMSQGNKRCTVCQLENSMYRQKVVTLERRLEMEENQTGNGIEDTQRREIVESLLEAKR